MRDRGKNPLVSFVVPCYNYGRYLAECMNSIFCQEGYDEFEVIVIDDGSTDDTQAVLRRFADPRLRVITHPVNLGHAATVNEGLRLARGAFIARIDPDDRYRSHFLRVTLEKFDRFPEVGVVYGDAALIDEEGRVTLERCRRVHVNGDYRGNEFVRLLEDNFICSPTVIARREAWQYALPVPEHLAFHDWYFTLMMARKYDFYYVNEVVAEYRVHPGNHHTRVVRDKSEEASIFWLLDRIYGEREEDPILEREKFRARRRVYAAQYLTLGTKYFGCQMYEDARRCFLRALWFRPRYVLRPDLLRWLVATWIGHERYEWTKKLVRSVIRRVGS
jgi:glycosyltransferase involved in cell wall biosynthesis